MSFDLHHQISDMLRQNLDNVSRGLDEREVLSKFEIGERLCPPVQHICGGDWENCVEASPFKNQKS